MTEFGVVMEASPGVTAPLATKLENMGFDYLLCPDTQNLSPDPYGQLSLVSSVTESIKMGTGVTNPLTRVSAVTATAMMSLQKESAGRAICGIGRGDSSAAHIGLENATTAQLRTYIEQIKALMAGETVEFGKKTSALRWLEGESITPVPVDLACTGPRTIALAADIADRFSFAVGSADERLEWALETVHRRLQETGRDRSEIQIGAYVNLVCDEDEERAIQLGRMISGMVAHFAGMKNAPLNHLPDKLKPLAEHMQTQYDMKHHSQDAGSHLQMVDDDFVDWFSICGPADKCRERLSGLIGLGLDHVCILGGSPVAHPPSERQIAMVEQTRHFAERVMPAFRK